MSLVDMAAIYLEDSHVSGDTMIEMNHGLDELTDEQKGSFYLHDLMTGFVHRFIEAVEREAENNMLKTGKLEGAHYAAMKRIAAAIDEP